MCVWARPVAVAPSAASGAVAGVDRDLLRRTVAFRRDLHRWPEPSNAERGTARRVEAFLRDAGLRPLARGLGGHGLMFRVQGEREGRAGRGGRGGRGGDGPRLLFRADLDALPIAERTGLPHRSRHAGTHHACGHDGHMAMLAGALAALHADPDFRGEVIGLFQPAEETGEGARRVVDALVSRRERFDQVLAIHNLPGLPVGSVGIRRGVAARASTGLEVAVTGRRGHASEPDHAANPLPALARLALALQPRATVADRFAGRTLSTLVGWRSEGPNFGVSPGGASLFATLRGDRTRDVEGLIASVGRRAQRLARAEGLRVELRRHDPFPHTGNAATVVAGARRAAARAGLTAVAPPHPLSASEDFGHFTARWPGALLLLGAGVRRPPLHSAAYDFPDSLVARGIGLWRALAGAGP